MMVARAGTTTALESNNKAAVAGERLLALDGLRGLTVFLMLLVNNLALQESTPDQLVHAPFGGDAGRSGVPVVFVLHGGGHPICDHELR